ncbi:hypothetical protein ASD64_06870 [Mesorhizobium sp. Root157]|nr:hypothetical protein ASD64_06870 [Mesorhizobium sp. Root157]
MRNGQGERIFAPLKMERRPLSASSSSGKPEHSERRDPRIHAVRLGNAQWLRMRSPLLHRTTLPLRHGMDPRVCATAFGLLRPRMTKEWVCFMVATLPFGPGSLLPRP